MGKGQILITTRTPYRITLGGGGSDVLWFSKIYGGAWIAASINRYIHVRLGRGGKGYKKCSNEDKIIKACLKVMAIKQRLRIFTKSDIRPQSGLGGSGALEVGLLHALKKYKGERLDREELARIATLIETEMLKMPVGPQDQYIAALGGLRSFEIDTSGNVKSHVLRLSNKSLNKLRENLFLYSTDITKDTYSILKEEENRMEKNSKSRESIINELSRIKELGLRAKKYLELGKLDRFGKLLHTHWLRKKQLTKEVTNPKIDRWYNQAIKNGAMGGKIMGAGGGGWFMFYITKNKNNFDKNMQKLGLKREKIDFDWEGTKCF